MCEILGMEKTIGSGSRHVKGDGQDDQCMIEHKSSITGEFTLTYDIMKKLYLQALEQGREPILTFEIAREGMWMVRRTQSVPVEAPLVKRSILLRPSNLPVFAGFTTLKFATPITNMRWWRIEQIWNGKHPISPRPLKPVINSKSGKKQASS
jgi:hypothetical protein